MKRKIIFLLLVIMLSSMGVSQLFEDPYGWSGRRGLKWKYLDTVGDWDGGYVLDFAWEPFEGRYSVYKKVGPEEFLVVGTANVTDYWFSINFYDGTWFVFWQPYPPELSENPTQSLWGEGRVNGVKVRAWFYLWSE